MRFVVPLTTVLALLAFSPRAHALQPLEAFIAASRHASFDAREARATLAQRDDEAVLAKWRLLPTLSASAVYTRNQYEAVAVLPANRQVIITPENQVDAFVTLSLPLVDVASWQRVGAADRTRDAAASRLRATERDVEAAVCKTYFQVLANEAVLASAQKALATQEKNLAFVETREAAGVASDLDVRRARADVERARQDVAEATYQVDTSRRALETASGLAPEAGASQLTDDLHPEPPLAEFMAMNSDALPDVAAAVDDAVAQEATARATRASLLPTVSVTGTERITNATGFAGQSAFYQVLLTAQFKLDASVVAQAKSQDAAAVAAHAREDKARRAAMDRIFNAYARVAAQIDKARAARAQVTSSDAAAERARQRYQAGTANFIDVSLAERDLFAAEVARVQADADLAFARVDLRLAAGLAPSSDTVAGDRRDHRAQGGETTE
jgi:outer membrane protein TolC